MNRHRYAFGPGVAEQIGVEFREPDRHTMGTTVAVIQAFSALMRPNGGDWNATIPRRVKRLGCLPSPPLAFRRAQDRPVLCRSLAHAFSGVLAEDAMPFSTCSLDASRMDSTPTGRWTANAQTTALHVDDMHGRAQHHIESSGFPFLRFSRIFRSCASDFPWKMGSWGGGPH